MTLPGFRVEKVLALGEARTHNPGITWCTVYKYRALTDCATRAACFHNQYLPLHCLQETLVTLQPKQLLQKKKMFTHGETRTRNLRFRRPTPYPLGHAGCVPPWLKSKNFQISNSLFFFISFFGLGVFVKMYITWGLDKICFSVTGNRTRACWVRASYPNH